MLFCPKDTIIQKGQNDNLSIAISKFGRPYIVEKQEDALYLLLVANITENEDSCFFTTKKHMNSFEILAIGKTEKSIQLLLKARKSDLIIVLGTNKEDVILIHENHAYNCTKNDLELACTFLKIKVPCQLLNYCTKTEIADDLFELEI